MRKATYTYGNLIERKAFTVSVPSRDQAAEADYIGIASGRDVDKFVATGLTHVRSELVDAPYVQEFPLVLECKVVLVSELGLHTQFVGEIFDVKVEDGCLDADGKLLVEKIAPMMYAPEENAYYGLGERLGKAFAHGRRFEANP